MAPLSFDGPGADLTEILDRIENELVTLAPSGAIEWANHRFSVDTGYSQQECVGKMPGPLLGGPRTDPATIARINASLAANRPVREEILNYRKDGTTYWSLLTITPIVDEAGGLLRFVVVGSDITERKRTEQALRESEERFRLLVEGAEDYAIFMLDPDGRVASWSEAAARVLGWRAEEIIGKPSSWFHPVEDVQCGAHERKLETARTAGRFEEENWRVRKNGTRFWADVDVTSLRDESGRGRGFAVVLRDVTERRAVERMKNEFVSTVSHELRTPLTSIRGALGLLAGGVVGAIPSEAIEIVDIALANTERLIRLINDILDLEKMEAGKLDLRMHTLDPAKLVATAHDGIAATASQAGVGVRSDVRTSARVRADDDRILQVLWNLLSNALKFSPRGSFVTTHVERGAPGMVRFSVTDEGPGISRENVGRLFGRFQQIDGSDARRKGGTGLGLAICKAIVEQHGGTVGVETEPGRGSTFWFEVPEQRRSSDSVMSMAAVSAPSSAPSESGRRVLVVDGSRSLRAVLAARLRALGLVCFEAEDGAKAISLARSVHPDLLIMEVALPRPDGFEVVDILRAENLGTTPLIVYTGRDLGPAERESLTLGPTRYLTKARASDDELTSTIRSLLATPDAPATGGQR